jgi:hypothetical protein
MGIRDATAKTIGIIQIANKYDTWKMNREATIIKTMVQSLAKGFIACIKPFLPLKSSM